MNFKHSLLFPPSLILLLSYQPLPPSKLMSVFNNLLFLPAYMIFEQNYFLLRVRRRWRSKRGGERRGRGVSWVCVELVGRSGAAPPVIIRVTAARTRLCAACTRRDVLPREKCEHLSVPPCRQQPPTSLSNSTQLVTRSPNSYFLSLARSLKHTHSHSVLLFLFRSLPPSHTAPLTPSLFRTGCESSRPLVQCRLQKKTSACNIWTEMNFMWVRCQCA